MYTIQYFIDKFESVPGDKWAINTFYKKGTTEDGKSEVISKRCAQGLCGIFDRDTMNSLCSIKNVDNVPIYLREAWSLIKIFKDKGLNVGGVNNGSEEQPYKQSTPQGRILAALRDFQKKENEVHKIEERSKRTTYVSVDKSIDTKVTTN